MDDDFTLLTQTLSNGGIAVVRTDTIYGIIALASNEAAVSKVYQAKDRDPLKQCIVLIPSADFVPAYSEIIEQFSNGDQPTSVVVPASGEPAWLLRSGETIAYRVVRNELLKKVVEAVGPVIAPSANPEGMTPASNIREAKAFFGDKVDAYIDGGEVPVGAQASRIIEVASDGSIKEIRA